MTMRSRFRGTAGTVSLSSLQIANCKLPICNLQFLICNLQASPPGVPECRRSRSRVAGVGLLLILAISGCGASRLEQLLASIRSDDVERQRLALRELADMGADAAPAIPALIDLSRHRDADIRRLCGLALGRIAAALPSDALQSPRDAAISALARQLDDGDLAVRNTAAFGLVGLDPEHARAQHQLCRAMQQGDGGIIDRLTRTQPAPLWAVPTFIELLNRDRRPGIRRLAAVALGEIGRDDPQARTALTRALQDSDDRVRSAAHKALNRAAL
jgi:HEAT repeat protein